MAPEDFFIIDSNESYTLEKEKNTFAFNISIFPEVLFSNEDNLVNKFQGNSVNNKREEDRNMQVIIMNILKLYSQNSPNTVIVYKYYFELLALLFQSFCTKTEGMESDAKHSYQDNRFKQILMYINYYYRQPFTLNEIANKYYISVPYLSKIFKKQMGITFTGYLNSIRLENAVKELKFSDTPITRIALDNGFPNLSAFNRIFKEKNHMTPGKYRVSEQIKQKNTEKEEVICEHEKITHKLENYFENNLNSNRETNIIQIEADLKNTSVLNRNWDKIINIGYAQDILNSNLQQHIEIMQKQIGFTFARVWGILSDDMLTENIDDGYNIVFNFSNIDKLLDILIKNRLIPFMELGEKPKIIVKSLEEKISVGPFSNKIRTLQNWKDLISKFIIHCVNRYGLGEVSTWYFEVWRENEKVINKYNEIGKDYMQCIKNNKVTKKSLYIEYFEKFELISTIIKEIVPNSHVGGCGYSVDLEEFETEVFLKEWNKREIKSDFFSVLIYPIDFNVNNEQLPVENLQSPDPDYVKTQLENLVAILKKNNISKAKLIVAEWNVSISNRNFLNDSCFKAAYIVKNIIDSIGYTDYFGYWLYSDIFSEFPDCQDILYGGAGLITKDGIKKPGFHAFSLLRKMGDEFVSKGSNYLITKKIGNRIQIICFNYKHFNDMYYFNEEGSTIPEKLYDIFEDSMTKNLKIYIKNVTNGKYRLKKYNINSQNGSVFDEWLKLGAIKDVKSDEIEYLKQICIPHISVDYINVNKEVLDIKETLEPHEVCLIELDIIYD